MKDFDILTTGDLELENGEIVLTSGIDAIRQRVLIRMRTQIGEWDFDLGMGLDYFGEIYVKNADIGLIRSRIFALVASTPGVLEVRFVDVNFNAADRTLKVEFIFLVDADTDDEDTTAGTVEETLTIDAASGLLMDALGPITPGF